MSEEYNTITFGELINYFDRLRANEKEIEQALDALDGDVNENNIIVKIAEDKLKTIRQEIGKLQNRRYILATEVLQENTGEPF